MPRISRAHGWAFGKSRKYQQRCQISANSATLRATRKTENRVMLSSASHLNELRYPWPSETCCNFLGVLLGSESLLARRALSLCCGRHRRSPSVPTSSRVHDCTFHAVPVEYVGMVESYWRNDRRRPPASAIKVHRSTLSQNSYIPLRENGPHYHSRAGTSKRTCWINQIALFDGRDRCKDEKLLSICQKIGNSSYS